MMFHALPPAVPALVEHVDCTVPQASGLPSAAEIAAAKANLAQFTPAQFAQILSSIEALGLAAPTTSAMQQTQTAAAQQTAQRAANYQAASPTQLTTPPSAQTQPSTGRVPTGLGTDCLTPTPPLPSTVQIPATPSTTTTQPVTPSVTTATAPSCTPTSTTTQLGVYVGNPNNSDAGEQATTMAAFNSFASMVGTPTTMNTYVDQTIPASQWAGNAQWDAQSWAATPQLAPGKVTPVVALPMAQPGDSADADFQAIASGAWDTYINGVLQAWASAGYTTIDLRPGWEMNGNWEPWSVTASNAADYIAAFQHIASLAHSFNSMIVNVVWNPNVGGTGLPTSLYYRLVRGNRGCFWVDRAGCVAVVGRTGAEGWMPPPCGLRAAA